MQFTNDNRAVSEVIGAILVFGLLIALMAIIQTQAVPAANQQVEFDHNQEVQGDLAKFHERVSRVSLSGAGESVNIQAGTGYPSRMVFFNPPRATGTISTSDAGTATLENVRATEPEVRHYLNGSHTVNLESRTFEYRVNYNEFQNSPTSRYEYGILYNEHKNATIVHNSGTVIDDTNINLVFMAGNYSESSGTGQSVDIEPVSAPARPVTVTGDGNDINITLPTDMPIQKWEDLYGDQSHVTINNASGDVKITLDGDRKYTLRMAGIGLESGIKKPSAHYIVPADDGVATIGAGDNATVKYEVRDKYNNPVDGVNVTIDGKTKQTDGEGRVTKTVSPGSPATFNGTIKGCTAGPRCHADFRVQVTDLNPNPSSGVRLVEASETSLLGLSLSSASGITFESQSESVNMTQFRINHYHPNPESHSPVELRDSDGNSVSGIEIGGRFVNESDGLDNINPVEPSGTSYDLLFDSGVDSSEYYVLTIVFENGERSLYFVSPT